MYTVQISDRVRFLEKLKQVDSIVTLAMTPTVIPADEHEKVWWAPALLTHSSFVFVDPELGECRWSFVEVLPTDETGKGTYVGSVVYEIRGLVDSRRIRIWPTYLERKWKGHSHEST